jgi:hypothetical protein
VKKFFAPVLKYGNKHTTIHGRIGSVARPAPPSREGEVQSPVRAQLLVLFFCSTVRLLHLNRINTLFMALHDTAVRIKKKFQVSLNIHQTPKEGRFKDALPMGSQCAFVVCAEDIVRILF